MIAPVFPDALVGRIPFVWRALATIVALCGMLLALVESRARILRSGAEIRLAIAPIDPRALFRGDYVVLNYEISRLDAGKLGDGKPLAIGRTIYVRLAPGPDGLALARGLGDAYPAGLAADERVIAGRIAATGICPLNERGGSDCGRGSDWIRVAYGIESYFVPEGSGKRLERTDRKRLEIVAALSSSGEAAIKRLLLDGVPVYNEPPY